MHGRGEKIEDGKTGLRVSLAREVVVDALLQYCEDELVTADRPEERLRLDAAYQVCISSDDSCLGPAKKLVP